jgi:hypothetical protein
MKAQILGMDLANLKRIETKYLPNGNRKKDVVDNIQAIKTKLKISSMKQNVQNAKGLWKK